MRFSRLLTLAALAFGPIVPLAAPAHATVSFSTPSPGVITESSDYASESLADPWDYVNSSDQRNAHSFTKDTKNFSITSGVLSFTTGSGGASITPVWSIAGALNHSRDGSLQPINAARYTHASFRMYSSSASSGVLSWYSCASMTANCYGARTFKTHAGWHVYAFQIYNSTRTPAPWSGLMRGLRFQPSALSGTSVKLDWLRLYRRNANIQLRVSHNLPGNVGVYWDRDTTTANNNGVGAYGLLGTFASGATVTFPASAFPPGTYYVYVRDGQVTRYSSAMMVASIPRPVVLNPNIVGGTDYAAVHRRGDVWDFSQTTDAGRLSGATGSVSGGLLNGRNTTNDPQVPLPLMGSFSGTSYHRLTFRMYYDGPFGLSHQPGGGCLVRLVWRTTASAAAWQESNDIVVFPGWNTVSVDLHSAAAKEPSTRQVYLGWGGRVIDRLRFDPNEDPGARTWHIDSIQLRDNDAGRGGFTFSYVDKSLTGSATSTAKFFLDTDRTPHGGGREYAIGSRSVRAGTNTWAWQMPNSLPAGTYWLRMESTSSRGISASRYSTGPVRLAH